MQRLFQGLQTMADAVHGSMPFSLLLCNHNAYTLWCKSQQDAPYKTDSHKKRMHGKQKMVVFLSSRHQSCLMCVLHLVPDTLLGSDKLHEQANSHADSIVSVDECQVLEYTLLQTQAINRSARRSCCTTLAYSIHTTFKLALCPVSRISVILAQ